MAELEHMLFNHDEVRAELRRVRDALQRQKEEHIRAWENSPSGHQDSPAIRCEACKLWDARMQGVDRVTKHFGGRVRRG